MIAGLLCGAALAGASAAGMQATWAVRGPHLEVTLSAPTTGWILVGFHTDEALAGARLVMISVGADGAARLEEHVAAPPRHAARTSGALPALLEAAEADGATTARFLVPLDPADPALPTLRPGEPIWLWLAWSHRDDFQHHSARREGVWVTL